MIKKMVCCGAFVIALCVNVTDAGSTADDRYKRWEDEVLRNAAELAHKTADFGYTCAERGVSRYKMHQMLKKAMR